MRDGWTPPPSRIPNPLVRASLVQDPEEPRVRTPPDEALGVRGRDGDARLPPAAQGAGLHVLPDRPPGPAFGVLLHLEDDLVPGTEVGHAGQGAYAVHVA